MIIRVQSHDGTKRINVSAGDSTKKLYEKVHEVFDLSHFRFLLYLQCNRHGEIVSSNIKTLKGYKLKHGDMIYMHILPAELSPNLSKEETPSSSSSSSVPSEPISPICSVSAKSSVREDDVDIFLSKQDGKIKRERNSMFCRHLGNSKCIHCTPLDPWDEGYLKENNIKHLSFHSYLRKLTSGVDKGKFVYLENLSCRIKPGCQEHPPWPQGICSKCQPSAVTLNRQIYRHVDNIVFENPNLVELFLNYWRTTGHQRVGLLYGVYEPHLDLPLGIKARVAAIYEPPQEGSKDHVRFLPDPKREVVDEIAYGLGLTCVGWIFTDLVPLDSTSGTVRYLRHADTFFLSAHEVITAANFQSEHPNPCRHSPNGVYGSKFTTVIVTGDSMNQVHMEGYQVSNQSQALVRDKCLIPTKDAPELAYVKESSAEQYVPDVYFKEKDQYGNDVIRMGRPLPVEYLLLDCPVSTPVEPMYTLAVNDVPFPVENRFLEGHLQSFEALVAYLKQFNSSQFLEAMSDFHMLVFIATMDMLPLQEYLSPLLDAVRRKDREAAKKWQSSEQWATMEELVKASAGGEHIDGLIDHHFGHGEASGGTSEDSRSGLLGSSASWTCQHCTFINQNSLDTCEICHLPH